MQVQTYQGHQGHSKNRKVIQGQARLVQGKHAQQGQSKVIKLSQVSQDQQDL